MIALFDLRKSSPDGQGIVVTLGRFQRIIAVFIVSVALGFWNPSLGSLLPYF
jgi:hypothetical protein